MKCIAGSNTSRALPLLCAIILALMLFSRHAIGQSQYPALAPWESGVAGEPIPKERWESGVAGEPIPKERYESWSLFLISNPEWLSSENNEKLMNLYEQFKVFGEVIGPKHLATWFWKRYPEGTLADAVDVGRCSQYCAKFGLLPSKSPHVLITTSYPDLNAPVGNYCVLELNQANAKDITALLTKLADQLLVQGLRQTDLDSEQYWRAWQRTFEGTKSSLAKITKKVRLTVDTKFFKVEIGG